MTSIRPYLLRAFYDWISDNGLTPHLIVDATMKGVNVPHEYVVNGQIILDIADDAVDNFEITATSISFEACFNDDESTAIFLPLRSILAIYALENEEGMSFVDQQQEVEWNEHEADSASFERKGSKLGSAKRRVEKTSHLTVIK